MDEHSPAVIVTGGGSGIGRAVAQRLAESGMDCVISGRRGERLEETASRCKDLPGQVITCVADMAEPAAIQELLETATGSGEAIAGIVNNAGSCSQMVFPDWPPMDMASMLWTNTIAPLNLVTAAWPYLVKAGGRIVNISSLAVLDPFPGNGAYGITKCALDGLTRAIHADAPGSGVKAFSIAAGAVETEMLRSIVDEQALPTDRTMAPGEIAQLVLSCLSGDRDDQAGSVLYAPIPGRVTLDPDEALAAMGEYHAS